MLVLILRVYNNLRKISGKMLYTMEADPKLKYSFRILLMSIGIFLLFGISAIISGMWVFMNSPAQPVEETKLLRVGILNQTGFNECREDWEKTFKGISSNGLKFIPVFYEKKEDLQDSLRLGVVDLVYCTNDVLKKNSTNYEPFMLTVKESDMKVVLNRSLLLVDKESSVDAISLTKNSRLGIAVKGSLFGDVVPNLYFSQKLPTNKKDWFREIVYFENHSELLYALKQGKIDVAASSYEYFLRSSNLMGYQESEFRILWYSGKVTERHFAIRTKMDAQDKAQILKQLSEAPAAFYDYSNSVKFVDYKDTAYSPDFTIKVKAEKIKNVGMVKKLESTHEEP